MADQLIVADLIKALGLSMLVLVLTYLGTRWVSPRALSLFPFILAGIGITYQLLLNGGIPFRELGFIFGPSEVYLQGVATVLSVLLLIFILGRMSRLLTRVPSEESRSILRLFVNILIQIVVTSVVAVVTEEFVFRGLIQRQLEQAIPPIPALLLASAVFGIWHVLFKDHLGLDGRESAIYALGTGAVGAIFGAFYTISGSLILAGILHGIWNGFVYPIWGLGEDSPMWYQSTKRWITHPEYGVIGAGTALAGFIVVADAFIA